MLIEADLLDAPVAGELRYRPGGALLVDAIGGRIVEAAKSVMDTGQPGSAGSANDTYPGGSETVLEWHCHPVSAGGEVVAVLVLGTPAKVE